jgi:hypothetical protein
MKEATNEQQHAADKVKEAALLLQLMLRRAVKLGVEVSAFIYNSDEPRVDVRCYLSEETELSNTKPMEGRGK